MSSRRTYQSLCPIARSLDRLGDRWSLLILRDLHAGPARFTELQEGLGVASNLLSSRLRDLTDDGLVCRTGEGRQQVYELTPLGWQTERVLWELARFGLRLEPDPEPRPPSNLRTVVVPLRVRLSETPDRPELTALLDVDGEHFTVVSTPDKSAVLYNDESVTPDVTVRTDYGSLLDFAASGGTFSVDQFDVIAGHDRAPALLDLLARAFRASESAGTAGVVQ